MGYIAERHKIEVLEDEIESKDAQIAELVSEIDVLQKRYSELLEVNVKQAGRIGRSATAQTQEGTWITSNNIVSELTDEVEKKNDYIIKQNARIQELEDRQVINDNHISQMFALQMELNMRIGVHTAEFNDEQRTEWVQKFALALQMEVAELIDSVPWKWWAKYQKFDLQNARVEVVDCFHFLISLAQTLGMSAEDVYQAYVKKNEINHARQDEGYVEKTEDCKDI